MYPVCDIVLSILSSRSTTSLTEARPPPEISFAFAIKRASISAFIALSCAVFDARNTSFSAQLAVSCLEAIDVTLPCPSSPISSASSAMVSATTSGSVSSLMPSARAMSPKSLSILVRCTSTSSSPLPRPSALSLSRMDALSLIVSARASISVTRFCRCRSCSMMTRLVASRLSRFSTVCPCFSSSSRSAWSSSSYLEFSRSNLVCNFR
mmetsp:Transcript_13625/g.32680  ORF Transcript_13625/g.32680 Transcript_13625/m.32680 type:complete len:209 (+) Transcript_13625:461-1087(+)